MNARQAVDDYMREQAAREATRRLLGPGASIGEGLVSPDVLRRIGTGEIISEAARSVGLGGAAGEPGGGQDTIGRIVNAARGAVRGSASALGNPSLVGQAAGVGTALLRGAGQAGDAIGDWWNDDSNELSLPYRMGGARTLFNVDLNNSNGPLRGYIPAAAAAMTGGPFDVVDDSLATMDWERARMRARADDGGDVAFDASRLNQAADSAGVNALWSILNAAGAAGDVAALSGAARLRPGMEAVSRLPRRGEPSARRTGLPERVSAGTAPRDARRRLAAAGAVGAGSYLALSPEAGGEESNQELAAVRARVRELEGAEEAFSQIDPANPESVRAAQRALQARGMNIVADGELGPETARAIAQYRQSVSAELSAVRERRDALELEERSRATRAGPVTETLREAAPWAATAAGLYFGHRSRAGAVRKAESALLERNRAIDALLTDGPVRLPRTPADRQRLARRVGNINEFWQRGGAENRVPFRPTSSELGFSTRSGAAQASELYQDGRKLRPNDWGHIGAGLTEAGASGVGLVLAQQELDAAQAAVDADPSEHNLARLERARNYVAFGQSISRAGAAYAAGRLGGAFIHPYSAARPNVPAAEAERIMLNQLLAQRRRRGPSGANLGIGALAAGGGATLLPRDAEASDGELRTRALRMHANGVRSWMVADPVLAAELERIERAPG